MKRTYFILFSFFSLFALALNGYIYSLMLDHTNPLRTEEVINSLFSLERWTIPLLFLILLVQTNRIAREQRRGHYFMASALFFVGFTVLDYVLLGEIFFHYRKETGLWQGEFSLLGFAGFFFSFIAVIISWVNYFVANKKGRRRNHALHSDS